MSLSVAFVFTIYNFIKKFEWNENTLLLKLALSAGTIAFLIALTPIQELDTARPDNTQGMIIVGAVATVLLILLKRKVSLYVNNQTIIAYYCSNCGKSLLPETIFCPNCGKKKFTKQ
jgi:hypothetical protein